MTESKEPTTVDGEAPAAKPKRSRAVSLVDRVFDRLSEGIQKGDYPPDSKLPGEHELAAVFDRRPVNRALVASVVGARLACALQDAGVLDLPREEPGLRTHEERARIFVAV